MASPAGFSEEECLNVYWKIENFSFCCENIESPEFSISGEWYRLLLCTRSVDVECRLRVSSPRFVNARKEISFLTCDDSPAESNSGCHVSTLRVQKDVIFRKRRSAFLPEDTLTVRFRYETSYERGKVFFCSRIGVKRKYFLWTIKSFNYWQLNSEKSVEQSARYGEIKLTLKSVGGVNADEQFYIEISRKGGEKCYYSLKVSVLDVDWKAVNEVSDEFVYKKEDGQHIRVFPAFFKKAEFPACKDTISLKCNFAISLGTLADQTDVISYDEDVTPFLKESDNIYATSKEKNDSVTITGLQTDLKSSFEDGTLLDVSLQIGSEIIRAHKYILSARSPVFKAMFTKKMQETNSSTVVIEDCDVETVRSLLLYMYTDTLQDNEWENVRKLYFAADKYEVLGLKRICASFLKDNLSISNVCEALVLADLHQDQDVKASTLDFISKHDTAVFASEAWTELEKTHSALVIHVLREIYCK